MSTTTQHNNLVSQQREARLCADKFNKSYVVLCDRDKPSFHSVETLHNYLNSASIRRYKVMLITAQDAYWFVEAISSAQARATVHAQVHVSCNTAFNIADFKAEEA